MQLVTTLNEEGILSTFSRCYLLLSAGLPGPRVQRSPKNSRTTQTTRLEEAAALKNTMYEVTVTPQDKITHKSSRPGGNGGGPW